MNTHFYVSLLLWALPIAVSAQPPSTDGLIAYWKFDETSGATAIDTAGNSDATLNAGASFAPGQGQSDGALQINGTTGGASASTFDLSGEAMTLSAWIMPNGSTTSNARIIIAKSSSSSLSDLSFSLSMSPQEALDVKVNLWGGHTNTGTGVKSIKDDVWSHVAVTYDGANLKIYIDGVRKATANGSGPIMDNSNMTVGIGNRPVSEPSDQPFDGLIDELRVYNRALTQSEVISLTSEDAYRQLPVTFTAFSAAPTHSGVVLDWKVEDQVDNAGFAVERAVNPRAAFTEIGFVPSRVRGRYSFTDFSAPAGRVYYRLRQEDHDGTVNYSETIQVKGTDGEPLSVYPNPASEYITIRGNGDYVIMDALSRQLKTGTVAEQQSVSLSDLPTGTYTLLLNRQKVRFVKH